MSIKIYGGKLLKAKNFYDLNEKLKTLRDRMEKIKNKKVAKKAAEEVVEIVDHLRLFGTPPVEYRNLKTVYDVFQHIRDKVQEDSKSPYRIDSDWDLESSISLFPMESGKVLAIYNNCLAIPALDSCVKNQPWIFDYHYQNSTDRPNKISARVWNQRKKDWNEVFAKSGRSSECGPKFVLTTSELGYGCFNDWIKNLPDLKTRKDKMFKAFQQKSFDKSEIGQECIKNSNVNNLYTTLFKPQREFYETNEKLHKEIFERDYVPLLVDITKEDLDMEIKTVKKDKGV